MYWKKSWLLRNCISTNTWFCTRKYVLPNLCWRESWLKRFYVYLCMIMCIYVKYIYICMYMYVYMHTYIHMYIYTYINTCIYVCFDVFQYVKIVKFLLKVRLAKEVPFVCDDDCLYIWYICMFIDIYIYIYMFMYNNMNVHLQVST